MPLSHFLTFSDAAKFADIARNIVSGSGYGSNFSFYSPALLERQSNFFSASGVPILVPQLIALFFRAFGTSDISVIMFSLTFYIFLIVAVFFLAKKVYGNLVGVISALAVASSQSLMSYAVSGASELLYMFLSVSAAYLIYVKKWWTDILFFLFLILIYLSKAQGIVIIGVLLLAWFLYKFSWRRGLKYYALMIAGIILIDRFVLFPLSYKIPVYPIVTRGIQALLQYSPTTAVSDALRGQTTAGFNFSVLAKKTFYNLYNFYKLLPEYLSPYLWGLFVIGLIVRHKDKGKNLFTLLSVLAVAATFLLTALTIPFYRYLHPVLPFVYILGSSVLVWVVGKTYSNQKTVLIISLLLISVYMVGQTLGVIFLDSRFERNVHNVGKPPVYVKLSEILKENTNENQVIVTNLDTWGTWYGERKTVWFPLQPSQLIDPETKSIPFDAIYLTSYLMDDDNYRMGDGWRQIFENPENSAMWKCYGCDLFAKDYKLKGTYTVNAEDNYERQEASAILLVKK